MPDTPDSAHLPKAMQEAIEWLVLLRSGEIEETDTHAFAEWLSQDAAHAQAFAKAEDLLNDAAVAAQSSKVVTQDSNVVFRNRSNLTSELDKPSPRLPMLSHYRWLSLPMSLAVIWLVAVVLFLPAQSHWLGDFFSDYRTRTGELRNIQLSDGSRVLLDTNTAISVNYDHALRQITLHHGQAQFIVAKDSQRPFQVASGDLTIRALGTIFEIYHPGSGEQTVTVREHAVTATLNDKSAQSQAMPVEVKTGQRLSYDDQSHTMHTEIVNLAQAGAWRQSKLFINDRPLTVLVDQLNRYRTGRIYIADPELKKLRITGAFSLAHPDDTLDKVSKALGLQETQFGPWWVVLHR